MTDAHQTGSPGADPIGAEDRKIITLAVSAASRSRRPELGGACLRDSDGRTYAGSAVAQRALVLSPVQVVIAMAVSSGAAGVEAVALAGAVDASPDDLEALRELGTPVLLRTDRRGELIERTSL